MHGTRHPSFTTSCTYDDCNRSCPSQFLPSVTELVVAQCYYLDFDDRNRQRPIYVYLNSTGCINDKGQVRPRHWGAGGGGELRARGGQVRPGHGGGGAGALGAAGSGQRAGLVADVRTGAARFRQPTQVVVGAGIWRAGGFGGGGSSQRGGNGTAWSELGAHGSVTGNMQFCYLCVSPLPPPATVYRIPLCLATTSLLEYEV